MSLDDMTGNPYADEARERWGDTPQYQESQRRTATYTGADWDEIRRAGGEIEQALGAALRAGEPATGDTATDLAERHRLHIDRWFYPCPPQTHTGLGDMYVADARFTAHYEEVAPGLARYLRDAIHANAARIR